MARGVHVAGSNNGLTRDGGASPGIALLKTTSLSASGWMKITGNSAVAWGHIPISLRNVDPPNQNFLYIETDAGDANAAGPWGLDLWIGDDFGTGGTLGPQSVAVNEVWYYAIVATSNGSGSVTCKYYAAKDGDSSLTLVGTSGATTWNSGPSFIRYLDLGWTGFTGEGSNCDYTNWKVWTAALTSSELFSEMKSEAVVRSSNLWAHWKLPNASDLTDDGGSSRTLSARASISDGAMVVNDLASGSAYTLTADFGSFALTGQAAGLVHGYVITADVGTFTLTGEAVSFLLAHVIAAGFGSFALNGQNINMGVGKIMPAAQGSFALTGSDAALVHGYVIVAAQGSFALTGQQAQLYFGHVLAAGFGSFALTGEDVTLSYTPASGHYTLTADFGAFALTGFAAVFGVGRTMFADFGSFGLTGFSMIPSVGVTLSADTGFFTLTGADANLTVPQPSVDYTLVAECGLFTLTPFDVVFTGPPPPEPRDPIVTTGLTPGPQWRSPSVSRPEQNWRHEAN